MRKFLLSVNVQSASNLEQKDLTSASDPFVKVWLEHNPTQLRKTQVQKNTHDPDWDERFGFVIEEKDIKDLVLRMEVRDQDVAYDKKIFIFKYLANRTTMETCVWH